MWTSLTLALLSASPAPPFEVVGLRRDDGACTTSLSTDFTVGPRTIFARSCEALELWTTLGAPHSFEHELVLQRAPGHRGPLRVQLAAPRDWLGRDALGHRFRGDDGREWTYGAAYLLVDGARVPVEVERTEAGLELVVPERWLTKWPLHLDPLVTTELALEPRVPPPGAPLAGQRDPAVSWVERPAAVWTDDRIVPFAPDIFGVDTDDGGLFRLISRGRAQQHPVLAPWGDGGAALAFDDQGAQGELLVTVALLDGVNTFEFNRPGRAPSLAVGPTGEVYVAFTDDLVPVLYTLDQFIADGGLPLFTSLTFRTQEVTGTSVCVGAESRALALDHRDAFGQRVSLFAELDGGWDLQEFNLADAGLGHQRARVLCEDAAVWMSTWNPTAQRSSLVRSTAASRALSAPFITSAREPSLLAVRGVTHLAGVIGNEVVLFNAEAAVGAGTQPDPIFRRPDQPNPDGLVLASQGDEFLAAWTSGVTLRTVTVMRVDPLRGVQREVATSLEHQQDVHLATVQGQTLAVWRTGPRTLRARWLRAGTTMLPFPVVSSFKDVEDLSVAANQDFAVVAWREGGTVRWLRFAPGESGIEQNAVLTTATQMKVVSDGTRFWMTGVDAQHALVHDLGTGTAPGTGGEVVQTVPGGLSFSNFTSACLAGVCAVGRIVTRSTGPVLELVAFPSLSITSRSGVNGPLALTHDGTTLRALWQEGRTLRDAPLIAGELSPDAGVILRTNVSGLRTLDASPEAPVFVALGLLDRVSLFPLSAPDDVTNVPQALDPSLIAFQGGPAIGFHRYESMFHVNKAFVSVLPSMDAGADAGFDGGLDGGLDGGADAGVDAGVVDAGTSDGGAADPLVASGCTCRGADGALLSVLMALLLRRRSARSS